MRPPLIGRIVSSEFSGKRRREERERDLHRVGNCRRDRRDEMGSQD